VLPPRTDLTSRRKRAIATALRHGVHLSERIRVRLLPEVTHPMDDSFYASPENIDAVRPGDVLESRPVEVRGLGGPVQADAWQLKFRSTDTSGAGAPGVATLMIPRVPFGGPVRPLLSYQCAIDALGATSDPSYTLRRGDLLEFPLITLALRRGWAVVTTDYNGPQHAFCAFPLVARFVLDGIRAAINFEPAGFDAATPIGLWGYSGGANATMFAIQEQAAYAPELNIVGAAAGGAGVDIASSTHLYDEGNLLSGIPFASLIGLSRAYADFELHSVLTPHGQAMVAAAAEMTMEQLVASFPFVRCSELLTVPSVSDIPGMRFEEGSLRGATPMTALHLYHGVHDKYLPVADVDRLVERYRHEGVDVSYRRFRRAGHVAATFVGIPGSLRFLRGRFRVI
jgi:hypothetical protein